MATIAPYSSSASLRTGGFLDSKLRPAPLSDDATQAEAIDWLKRYVGAIDDDLSRIPNEIRQGTAAAIAAAAEQDEHT
jgi:hypothetical protein